MKGALRVNRDLGEIRNVTRSTIWVGKVNDMNQNQMFSQS